MDLGLRGKVAIVTGASKGMGKAICLKLAAEGVNICMVARNPETLSKAAAEMGKTVLTVPGDVSDPSLPDKVVHAVTERWKTVDILVNNAGGPPTGSFLDHSDSVWTAAIQQNFMSTVRFSQAVTPIMKSQKWGRIIQITSTIAKEPTPAMVLSAGARAGVAAFTKAIAIELAPFNITVNAIGPGSVMTDRATSLIRQAAQNEKKPYEEILARSEQAIPIKRFASPDEIASVVVFLASQQASYVTGTSLMVDGGLSKSFF
jgi:3-oxoacyl-[acyl-carrier protein] reductase